MNIAITRCGIRVLSNYEMSRTNYIRVKRARVIKLHIQRAVVNKLLLLNELLPSINVYCIC